MTAISPLEYVHKKGLFGDHHKKNENDLLIINEVKNLSIIQIVQYKKSKYNLSDIKIDDLKLPLQNLKVSFNKNTRILWNAPRTWIIISKTEDILKKIQNNFSNKDFAITDISHSRAMIQITGLQAKEVLKKGSPINFNEFEKNSCVGTIYHGINIIIDFVEKDEESFYLITLRSFGESLYHHITDASLEFGYIGI